MSGWLQSHCNIGNKASSISCSDDLKRLVYHRGNSSIVELFIHVFSRRILNDLYSPIYAPAKAYCDGHKRRRPRPNNGIISLWQNEEAGFLLPKTRMMPMTLSAPECNWFVYLYVDNVYCLYSFYTTTAPSMCLISQTICRLSFYLVLLYCSFLRTIRVCNKAFIHYWIQPLCAKAHKINYHTSQHSSITK